MASIMPEATGIFLSSPEHKCFMKSNNFMKSINSMLNQV